MKLVGVAMIRNESDVLEAFVRHNLTVVDELLVVDHSSVDGCEQILASLVREGLALVAMRDESPGFPQPAMAMALTRKAFSEHGADFVVPLDADEFLKVPSRPRLEAALRALPAGGHARLEWLTYVPSFDTEVDTVAALRTARRLAVERHGLTKVVVAKSFASQPAATIELGHHAVRAPDAATVAHHTLLDSSVAATAHVPIRSALQYSAKTAIGWLASQATSTRARGQSFHWQGAYEYLRSGRPLTAGHLTAAAMNYSVPPDRWLPLDAVELTDDPFLADFNVRYSHFGVRDPLALVLSYLDRVLGDGARRG